VGADAVTEFLKFAINGSLPQFWPGREWDKEDVDVLRKPPDQVRAFGQAVAAFEGYAHFPCKAAFLTSGNVF
jgi:hypothetical protein